jgi:hypothetical protein
VVVWTWIRLKLRDGGKFLLQWRFGLLSFLDSTSKGIVMTARSILHLLLLIERWI